MVVLVDGAVVVTGGFLVVVVAGAVVVTPGFLVVVDGGGCTPARGGTEREKLTIRSPLEATADLEAN